MDGDTWSLSFPLLFWSDWTCFMNYDYVCLDRYIGSASVGGIYHISGWPCALNFLEFDSNVYVWIPRYGNQYNAII